FAAPHLGGFAIFTLLLIAAPAAAMLLALWKPYARVAGWAQCPPLLLWILILGPYWLCSEVITGASLARKAAASAGLIAVLAYLHWRTRHRPAWAAMRACAAQSIL